MPIYALEGDMCVCLEVKREWIVDSQNCCELKTIKTYGERYTKCHEFEKDWTQTELEGRMGENVNAVLICGIFKKSNEKEKFKILK